MELDTIMGALSILYDACQDIRNYADCEKCPLYASCLETTSVADAAEGITKGDWDSFLKFSDDVQDWLCYDAEYAFADDMRQLEIEEAMIERDDYYD